MQILKAYTFFCFLLHNNLCFVIKIVFIYCIDSRCWQNVPPTSHHLETFSRMFTYVFFKLQKGNYSNRFFSSLICNLENQAGRTENSQAVVSSGRSCNSSSQTSEWAKFKGYLKVLARVELVCWGIGIGVVEDQWSLGRRQIIVRMAGLFYFFWPESVLRLLFQWRNYHWDPEVSGLGLPSLARNVSELQDVKVSFLVSVNHNQPIKDPSFWRESWQS